MKKAVQHFLFFIAITGLFAGCAPAKAPETESKVEKPVILANNMQIISPAFEHNAKIPSKYTCDGDDISPPLAISGVPEGAKSLVLISDDPDAPAGTWVHWTVWNIDPTTSKIPENSVPQAGIEGYTNFGKPGYGGPCPPFGEHRYFFKLYALDKTLDLDASAKKKDIEKKMERYILDKAELIGLYKRI